MVDLDIAVYSHRWSAWQVRAAESVAKHTKQSYRLIQITEPGTAHANLNRVLEASTAKYLVILDEDAAFVQDSWLDHFLQTIERGDVGLVGAYQIRHPHIMPPDEQVHVVAWTPGYFMGMRRDRIPDLRFDESIPGLNGMTDVDFCRQVAEMGLMVVQDWRIRIWHPQRDEDEVRAVEQRPTCKTQASWFHDQMAYMRAKWGEGIDAYVRSYFGVLQA